MTDSMADLLGKQAFKIPREIQIIKTFIDENYHADCQVSMGQQQIIISVRGASLAGALRLRLHELQTLCQTDKRLVIRITN